MALPVTPPYVFGNVTSSIPLTNLDADFATIYAAVNGIGNGTVSLANVTITGGSIQNVAFTLDSINNTPIGNVTPSTAVVTSLTDSGLTSGRVTYAGTGGLLQDSANMTFNGTTLTLANDASISGLTVGKGGGSQANSTAIGSGTLNASNSGISTAIGFNALNHNTTGRNTAIGFNCMNPNTTGDSNTAIGDSCLGSNTTGGSNTAIGLSALLNNTTASNNTAVGYQSLYSNTVATGNTALGYQAGYTNITGTSGTYLGFQAGYTSVGTGFVAVGYQAGYVKSGSDNYSSVFVGNRSGFNTTTGIDNHVLGSFALFTNTTGSSNIAIGSAALYSNTTASNNTAVGYQAGYTGTTASDNTYFGYSSGYSNSSGTYNTYIGKFAGYYMTGSKNTVIGRYDGTQGGLTLTSSSNYIVLSDGDGNPKGYFDNNGAFFVNKVGYVSSCAAFLNVGANGSNQYGITIANSASTNTFFMVFANSSGVPAGSIAQSGSTTVLYNVTSDYRLKDVVSTISDSGSRIDALQPINYTMKADGSAQRGFLAHQFQAIYPNSVSGEKDAVDAEGKPVYQAMQASSPEAMADIFAELQSLRKRVATLEAK